LGGANPVTGDADINVGEGVPDEAMDGRTFAPISVASSVYRDRVYSLSNDDHIYSSTEQVSSDPFCVVLLRFRLQTNCRPSKAP
jgi:hypothetical protein